MNSVLGDAVQDLHKDPSSYGYCLDYYGDDESGDVVYRSNGETKQAPYSVTGGDGFARKASIDAAKAMKVRGRMVYEPVMDEGEHYAAMSEAFLTAKIYAAMPLYERFVSKSERDAAGDADFAGKGKSFPILKRADVMAAVRSIGRAGSENSSGSTIKANIIAIAKRKGWEDELPKAWRPKPSEAAVSKTGGAGLRLVESLQGSGFLEKVTLKEAARTNYPILMITPGTGSTAHYSKDVLRKASEAGVFKKGAFMYWNHPTRAEEAARPELDLDNLAAITTSDGVYQENGVKGPGVYANAKPMADYADKIETRAPHIGLSIRAGGTSTGRTVEGKPELASIDYLESVDYVTRAGRGGMALAESERFTALLESFNSKEGAICEMDQTTITRLQETVNSQAALIERLNGRALRGDAMELGAAFLRSTSLNEAAKVHVLENVLGTVDNPRPIPMNAAGAIDAAKLTEAFTAEAKRVGTLAESLGGGGVSLMGPVAVRTQESAEQITARETREANHTKVAESSFARLMGDPALGKVAAQGRAA